LAEACHFCHPVPQFGDGLPLLIIVTLIGSTIGAFLLTLRHQGLLPLIVSIAVIGLASFSYLVQTLRRQLA